MPSVSPLQASLAALSLAFVCATYPAPAQEVRYSSAHRNSERSLSQSVAGTGSKALGAKLAGPRAGVSLAIADFDTDGTADLLTGYAAGSGGVLLVQRGDAHAVAPTQEQMLRVAAGEITTPFAEQATGIDLPIRPDFLKTADLAGHGHADILAASAGGRAVYVLTGDGHAGFAAPREVALNGKLNALATWQARDGRNQIVASVCDGNGCGLQFVTLNDSEPVSTFVATSGRSTVLEAAKINNGVQADLALVINGKVLVLDGDSVANGSPVFDSVPVAGAAVALTAGQFLYDRRGLTQLAVLDASANLHILARGEVDSTVPTREESLAARRQAMEAGRHPELRTPVASLRGVAWAEVEKLASIGPATGHTVMLHGHLSGNGMDDVVVMGAGQHVQVTHKFTDEASIRRSEAIVSVDSTSGTIAAALPARISADARLGVVSLTQSAQPAISVPTTYRTFFVNTNADATPTTTTITNCRNSTSTTTGATPICMLRSAIAAANQDNAHNGATNVDTINLGSLTYTLSATNGVAAGITDNHFNVDSSVNIVGTGTASTIISANNLDNIFTTNSSLVNASSNLDIFLTGMTLRMGKNFNDPATGYDTGGLIDADLFTAGYVTLTNTLLQTASSQLGPGGCIGALDSITTGAGGTLDIENSTLSGCSSPGRGGAVEVFNRVNFVLNGSTLNANFSSTTVNPAAPSPNQIGGGLDLQGASAGITNTTFTGNYTSPAFTGANSYLYGGGAIYAAGPMSITGSTFTGNYTLNNGGAIYVYGNAANQPSVTTSTFTGNSINSGSATGSDGGAIAVNQSGLATVPFVMHYSRVRGNTGGAHTGLGAFVSGDAGSTSAGLINATDNWWGCSKVPTATPCDIVGSGTGAAAVTTSPYTTLILSLSSATPGQGSSFTATGSLGQDSAGTVYSAANDFAYIGLPATVTVTEHDNSTATTSTSGTTLTATANPAVSSAAITATATATAVGTGLATVTVDGCTVPYSGSATNCTTVVSPTTTNFNVTGVPDLTITKSHTGNFKAGTQGNPYLVTVTNSGSASTSGTVSVVETLPTGFTLNSASGNNWTCNVTTRTCTNSTVLTAGSSYPVLTITVDIAGTVAGSVNNVVTVSGGGETNTANDTYTDATTVVGPPSIAESFNPTTVAPNAISTITFTLTNPAGNTVALTGVGFADTLPTGLTIVPGSAVLNCTATVQSVTGPPSTFTVSGVTLAPGASCAILVQVSSATIGSYTNTTGAVTATNSVAGNTASASLTVAVTPTKLVYTAAPASPISAGSTPGTVSVALEDAAGNIATNNSGTVVTLTITGPNSYSATYNANSASGIASFTTLPALTKSGTYTYTATSGALTQAQVTEAVNPAAATTFVVAGFTGYAAPGILGTGTVTAVDTYGNIVTTFTGNATITTSDPLATYPATITFAGSDNGVKNLNVTFNTAGTQSVTATSGAVSGSATGIIVADSIFLVNTNGTLGRLTGNGAQTNTVGSATTPGTLGAVAIDNAGNVRSVQNGASIITFADRSGSSTQMGNVNAPTSLAIDGVSSVWVTNSGDNTITGFTQAGALLSQSGTFTTGVLNAPTGVIVDSSGVLWVTNSGNNKVVKVFGGVAPAVTPAVNATANVTQGARP